MKLTITVESSDHNAEVLPVITNNLLPVLEEISMAHDVKVVIDHHLFGGLYLTLSRNP